ncbi:MAG: dihydroorotate dehydrogenase electron transfer subunit [Actinobacteria bacterium]|nr:dihydroorotate dehydrogenase electron transfer subunit [Actinomycetota bacterium]
MFEVKAEVIASKKITKDIYSIKILSPEISENAVPGQFVHLKCGEDKSFILRRPFSIHRVDGKTFELLFEVVGKGTRWLSEAKSHLTLDILGPIGRGFSIGDNLKSVMFVVGGMGVAPLVFLSDQLIKRKVKLYVAIGATTKDRLLYFMDLKRISYKIFVSTDDGTCGQKGFVTDLLNNALNTVKPEQIYACGPRAVLRKTAEISKELKIPCEVSMVERMACGIGACLGCACKTKGKTNGDFEYKRVCVDGPVFDAEEVVWS